MSHYFLDTSAYLKRYLREPGSDVIDSLFAEYATRSVSGVGVLECLSVLRRYQSVERLISPEQLRLLSAAVLAEIESGGVVVVNASPPDIGAGIDLLTRQYLTAVDALQVALAKALGPNVIFVSADAKLNRVASQEGLTVLDPTTLR